MKITREQLRTIVGEVLQEEKDYQSFFKAMLKKHGVSSPDEFKSDEEKKSFFNKVEDTWKGVSERLQTLKEDELTSKQQKIDLNKNGKVDGDDLSKLRAGTKTEAELSAAQQKIDLNKNGKVDGSDLSKLRAGAKTEGEMETSTSLTKILSKEGETLVKSGAGKMYNITKVNEAFSNKKVDAKVIADRMRNHKETKGFADKIEKLKMVSAEDLDKMLPDYVDGGVITKIFKESVNEASKPTIKVVNNLKNEEGIQIVVTKTTDGDTMYGGFVVRGKLQKMIPVGANDSKEGVKKRALQIWDEFGKQLGENKKINEAYPGLSDKKVDAKLIADKMRKDKSTKGFADKVEKMGKVSQKDLDNILPDYITGGTIEQLFKESIKEGKYDADLDKIEAAVKNASSFMSVGTELKKIGIKYDFTTSMMPMYMIKVSGNTIAIINKKYATDSERIVGDIAIGLLN
jgi:hypothetical protein